MTAVARRGRMRVGPAAAVSLSELDLRIIGLVSSQRVVTSTQLELLLSDVPGRTLRYRTEHLYRAGLVGRSRPYRERGSAPYHLWPSRRADALARGAPTPRGGERAEPNPLFMAHAAGVTELYALLATKLPDVRLGRFQREPREPFTADGRSRTLAPDALLEVHDDEGRGLLAFVELDLGTMSHARLKVKAGAYAAYAAQAAWTERYDFCPCLLFITTTEARAIAFLKTLAALLEKAGRGGFYDNRAANISWFAAGACAMAREPYRVLSEQCWDDLTLSGGGLCLLDCLRAARGPYDTARAEQDAAQRASEAERERLRSDPDARRARLHEHRLYARSEHFEQFGTTGAHAVELLLSCTRSMELVERSAFAAVARQLDLDPLEGRLAPKPVPASVEDREMVARLADAYRARQRKRVAQLTRRYGSGPKLRRHQELLASGGLIDVFASERLEQDAARDQQARAEQERLRMGYLQRREQEAKHRKYDVSLSVRLTQGRAAVLALIDHERLHICRDCEEIVYPPEPAGESYGYLVQPASREPARCHFCGAYQLDGWDERHAPGLLHGGAYQPSDMDLRSTGGSDLLDARPFGNEQEEQWL